jgi:hypothetical protein
MTDHSSLERRYRRWVALYPKSFRAEREEEMVAVLMQGADPDQTRPRAGEAADLVTHGLRRRAGPPPGHRPLDWERAHAKFMVPFRILFALFLFIMSVIIVAAHNGQLWGGELWLLLTVPGMLVHLWIVYRIRPSTTHR